MQARIHNTKNALGRNASLYRQTLLGSLASCIITPHFRVTVRQLVKSLGRSKSRNACFHTLSNAGYAAFRGP
jgi:hypothetical protein